MKMRSLAILSVFAGIRPLAKAGEGSNTAGCAAPARRPAWLTMFVDPDDPGLAMSIHPGITLAQ